MTIYLKRDGEDDVPCRESFWEELCTIATNDDHCFVWAGGMLLNKDESEYMVARIESSPIVYSQELYITGVSVSDKVSVLLNFMRRGAFSVTI